MSKSISKFILSNPIILILMGISLFEPDLLYLIFPLGHTIISITLVVTYLLSIIIYVECFRLKSFVNIILLYIVYLILSSFISNGLIWNPRMTEIVSALSFTFIIDGMIKKKSYKFFSYLKWILVVWVIINLITVIMNPNGIYQVQTDYSSTKYWFLGHKNYHIRYIITANALILLDSYLRKKHFDKFIYIFFVLCVVSLILAQSTTGILALILFAVFYLLFTFNKFKKKRSKFNIFKYYIFFLIIWTLIYFFQFQNLFSFIIENVFEKNLTLTSRTYIWKSTIEFIQLNPIIGQGILAPEVISVQIAAMHPHNYYLNLLYQGGILGFIFICFIYCLGQNKIYKLKNDNIYFVFCSFYFTCFFMGISESLSNMTALIPFLLICNLDINDLNQSEVQV